MHVLAALAFGLCTLLQTPSANKPIEKQNPASHKNNDASRQGNKHSHTAVSPSAAPYQIDAQQKQPYNPTPPKDRAYEIKVKEVPPSDTWIRAYVGITGVLAALNIIGLCLVWRQISISERMARLEYRAWLQFGSIDFSDDGGKFHVDISINNAGRTPAKDVNVCWVVEVPKELVPDFTYPPSSGILARPVFPPSANMVLPLSTSFKLDRSLWVAMEKRESAIFAHGKVTYTDVFGDPHWMTFCQIFETTLNRFAIYHEHNDTDD